MRRPKTIGRFEVVRELGRGAMGIVYEAHCPELSRSVALKVLQSFDATPEGLARFEREALAMAKVSHPNVVQIHDVGRAEVGPFLVTSLVEGQELSKVLAARPQGEAFMQAQAHLVDPQSLAFSADGRRLYSVAGEQRAMAPTRGELTVWDVAKLRPLAPPVLRRTSWFLSVDLSPDGRRLLTVSDDGVRSRLEVWNVDPLPPR